MIDIKNLTNSYLLLLSQTDIDSQSFVEIESFLREKIDQSMGDKAERQDAADRMKDLLIDKLASIPGVDKICMHNNKGYQFETMDLKANGAGPVTVLIID
ncbi:MAG TPA: hypothetical protein VEG39_10900 [Clostridia bacterium]|nr:hypothetical protein [Clostridia bacterium]